MCGYPWPRGGLIGLVHHSEVGTTNDITTGANLGLKMRLPTGDIKMHGGSLPGALNIADLPGRVNARGEIVAGSLCRSHKSAVFAKILPRFGTNRQAGAQPRGRAAVRDANVPV
jgi:hypothetical protein